MNILNVSFMSMINCDFYAKVTKKLQSKHVPLFGQLDIFVIDCLSLLASSEFMCVYGV